MTNCGRIVTIYLESHVGSILKTSFVNVNILVSKAVPVERVKPVLKLHSVFESPVKVIVVGIEGLNIK